MAVRSVWFLIRIVVAIPLILATSAESTWDAAHLVGLSIWLPSTAFWVLARIQIDRALSDDKRTEVLVKTGMYRYIRHPVYLFSSVSLISMVVYLKAPIFLAIIVPIILLQIWRARREERTMKEHFRERYEQYRHRTWF